MFYTDKKIKYNSVIRAFTPIQYLVLSNLYILVGETGASPSSYIGLTRMIHKK